MSDNISETVQDRDIALMEDRKSCMVYRMAWLPMTFGEYEGYFIIYNL